MLGEASDGRAEEQRACHPDTVFEWDRSMHLANAMKAAQSNLGMQAGFPTSKDLDTSFSQIEIQAFANCTIDILETREYL